MTRTLEPGTLEPGTLEPGTLEPRTLEPGTLEPEVLEPAPGARMRAAISQTADASEPAVRPSHRGEPLWLVGGRWPVLAWLHRPADRAEPADGDGDGGGPRGAVVLCPPLLGEQQPAQVLHRLVARELADRGLLVVRFDYEGTGDSGGPSGGPGRTAAWLDGVDQAVRLARRRCGGPLTLLGVRSGALVAALAASRRQDVDALVVWDPWPSGRSFLRRQRALHALRMADSATATDFEVPGFELDPATVEAIEALRLPGALPVRKALHVARPRAARGLAPLMLRPAGSLVQERADVVHAAPGEQEACFEVEPIRQQVPAVTASAVVRWVVDAATELAGDGARGAARRGPPDPSGPFGGSEPLGERPAADPVAIAPAVPGEVTLSERVLTLGPCGLFGIETTTGGPGARRADGDGVAPTPASPVTALFLSSGTESHVGPVRLWVTLSRRLAAAGVRCVRADLSGLGESPSRPGRPDGVMRAPEAFDDVSDLVDALGGPSTTVLVGLCSGAYQALESALELHPLGAVGVNPLLRFTPPEVAGGGPMAARRRLCQLRPAWVAGARKTVPKPVADAMVALRRLLERARGSAARPLTLSRELARAGVEVYCVCGEDEAHQLARAGLSESGIGSRRVDVIPGLDHGLTVAQQRQAVIERVVEAIKRMAGVEAQTEAERAEGVHACAGAPPQETSR